MGEYVDLYNSNKELTERRVFREKGKPSVVPEGLYIIVVLAIIVNSDGKYLFQKTSCRKGGVWALTGGHVKSGQTSQEAIKEEIKEELGIEINDNEISLFKTYKYDNAFKDVYIIHKDIDIKGLILEEDEVEKVQYLTIDEIKKLIQMDVIRKTNLDTINDMLLEDANL